MVPLHSVPFQQLRTECKQTLESLELWLRRLIHQKLSDAYGDDYFEVKNSNGDSIIKLEIQRNVLSRFQDVNRAGRYSRLVDALELQESVELICKPHLWENFEEALGRAFPDGREEARTFLNRLIGPRNKLAHANPISIREAEQIICYSHDVIDSLKNHYSGVDMDEFGLPFFTRIADSIGNEFHFSEPEAIKVPHGNSATFRPGDKLTIEVEVDPSFPADTYNIEWQLDLFRSQRFGPKITIEFEDEHIGGNFSIQVFLIANSDWHRYRTYDDNILLDYRVIPNIIEF